MKPNEFTREQLDELTWLKERYNELLERSWRKENKPLYPTWKAELIKADRMRTEIYLTQKQ